MWNGGFNLSLFKLVTFVEFHVKLLAQGVLVLFLNKVRETIKRFELTYKLRGCLRTATRPLPLPLSKMSLTMIHQRLFSVSRPLRGHFNINHID